MSVWRDKKGRYHVAVQRGGNRVHRVCKKEETWRDAKRKEAERERFNNAPVEAVFIKLADFLDNFKDFEAQGDDFAKTYAEEKIVWLPLAARILKGHSKNPMTSLFQEVEKKLEKY